MREFYEKARKEPKRYEKLLIEKLKSLESDFKFFSSWLVILINVIPLLYTMLRHLTFIEGSLLTAVIIVASFIILYEDVSVVREIRRVEELLYGDPMNRLRLVIIHPGTTGNN